MAANVPGGSIAASSSSAERLSEAREALKSELVPLHTEKAGRGGGYKEERENGSP